MRFPFALLAFGATFLALAATGSARQPAGYNIPLIDLAAETHRQVIVS